MHYRAVHSLLFYVLVFMMVTFPGRIHLIATGRTPHKDLGYLFF